MIFSGHGECKCFIDCTKNRLYWYKNDKTLYGLNNGKIVYDEVNAKIFFFDTYNGDINQMISLYDIVPLYYYADYLVHGYCKETSDGIPISIIDIIYKYFAIHPALT